MHTVVHHATFTHRNALTQHTLAYNTHTKECAHNTHTHTHTNALRTHTYNTHECPHNIFTTHRET